MPAQRRRIWQLPDPALVTDTDMGTGTIRARPTVTIVVGDTALNIGDDSPVTFTFSQVPTGFANADVSSPSGTLSAIAATGDPLVFTATLTPSLGVTDATNVITVGTVWTNLTGDAPAAATDSNNYEVDTVRPTVAIVLDDVALNIGDSALVTFTFSEAPTGFANADVSTPNGTLSTIAGGPLVFTATLTPNASVEDATNLISVGTVWTDPAGNAPAGATVSDNYTIDTLKPTVTVNIVDAALTVADTSSVVTFVFLEDVSGFTIDDLTPSGGTLSGFTTTDAKNYSATFTSNLGFNGFGSVTVGTDYTDLAGNSGTTGSDTVMITSNVDFGDAPSTAQSGFASSYPTLFADNGAFHGSDSGPYLGSVAPDVDNDGHPSAAADGDDTIGSDDEDGVAFPFLMFAGSSQTITVTASAPGQLDAWIDFNRDGDWNDSGERITALTGTSVVAGPNSLTFAVPANASGGTSYARFRISTAGGLNPTGFATDGEVEDYQVQIGSGNAALFPCPDDPMKLALVVIGTTGNDVIELRTRPLEGTIRVTLRSPTIKLHTLGDFKISDIGCFIVYALAGDDRVNSSTDITLGMEMYGDTGRDTFYGSLGADRLFGGPGHDKLYGREGGDMLLGEAGNDSLDGAAGNDVLIGGAGADKLLGGANDDILIGGTTDFDAVLGTPDYDADLVALKGIQNEWRSANTYVQRNSNLTSGGGLNAANVLTAATVHDDSANDPVTGKPQIDSLSGNAGQDWFIARTLPPTLLNKDKLTDRVLMGLLVEALDQI